MGSKYSVMFPEMFFPGVKLDNVHELHRMMQLFVQPYKIYDPNKIRHPKYASLYEVTRYRTSIVQPLKQIASEHGLAFISSGLSPISITRKSDNTFELYGEDRAKSGLAQWYADAKAKIAAGSPYASGVLDLLLAGSVFYGGEPHANTLVLTLLSNNKIIVCRHDGHGWNAKIGLDEFVEIVSTKMCKDMDSNLFVKFVPLKDAIPVQGIVGDCVGWAVILAIFTSLNTQYAETPEVLYNAIKKAGAHQISILFYLYMFIHQSLRYASVNFYTNMILTSFMRVQPTEFIDYEQTKTLSTVAKLFKVNQCTHKLQSETADGDWKCDPKYCIQCASLKDKDMSCTPKIIMQTEPKKTLSSHYGGVENVYDCQNIYTIRTAGEAICKWGRQMYPTSAIFFEYVKKYVQYSPKQSTADWKKERPIFRNEIATEFRETGTLKCISGSEEGCTEDTQKRKIDQIETLVSDREAKRYKKELR